MSIEYSKQSLVYVEAKLAALDCRIDAMADEGMPITHTLINLRTAYNNYIKELKAYIENEDRKAKEWG